MTDTIKLADDIYMVPWEEGNGQIRREVWVDPEGKVARYYLAYLNQDVFQGDDGMVLGYYYNNGILSGHLMGRETAIEFSSLVGLEEGFNKEWNDVPKQRLPAIPQGAAGPNENKFDGIDDYPETKMMKLTITKGSATDFFRRGKELAGKLDRGEDAEPERVVIFGNRQDLCYSLLTK